MKKEVTSEKMTPELKSYMDQNPARVMKGSKVGRFVAVKDGWIEKGNERDDSKAYTTYYRLLNIDTGEEVVMVEENVVFIQENFTW